MKRFFRRVADIARSLRALFFEFTDSDRPDAVSSRRFFRFLLLGALIFSVGFGVAFVTMLRSKPSVTLPDVTGQDVLQASRVLQDLKLRVTLDPVFTADRPAYQVLHQKPDAGMSVKEGRAVTLRVSRGTKSALMPDLKGRNSAEARAAILDLFAGFEKIPQISETPMTSQEAAGTVVDQQPPAGAPVSVDLEINLAVSRGDGTSERIAADWTMKNIKDVMNRLRDAGIEVRIEPREAAKADDVGKIFKQNVLPGSNLNRGDSVTFVVGAEKGKTPAGFDGEVFRVLRWKVPGKADAGAAKRRFELRVTDRLGVLTNAARMVTPGTLLQVPYKTTGPGKIEVYLDDELVHRDSF